jgi:molybdopterin-guanine dinucleotide biosynthesis protein A
LYTFRVTSAAAILAGGKATRMGGHAKSFLEVEGQRVIDRQLAVLRPLFSEILIVANDREPYLELGLPVVSDIIPGGFGPLVGILTALESAAADRVVCVACDMPYLAKAPLAFIRDHSPTADVLVPVVGGREEPLFARYAKAVVPSIRAQIATGDYKVSRFYARVNTGRIGEEILRILDPELQFLANVNTPEDLTSLPPPPRQ